MSACPTSTSTSTSTSPRLRLSRRLAGTLVVALSVAAGCSGAIEADGSPGPTDRTGQTPARPGAAPPTNPATGPGAAPPAGVGPTGSAKPFAPTMLRLTASQYRNTIADLFGPDIVVPELEEDTPLGGFLSVGASVIGTSQRGVELYEAAALAIARQTVGEPNRRKTIVGCEPASATAADAACAGKLIDRVGRRLYRRALDEAERARYLAVAADSTKLTGSFWDGLQNTLAAMLQAPSVIYRAERGDPRAAQQDRARFGSYDLAARLAFGLTDAGPDDALLDAAAKGELDTDQGVARHATRLLGSARGRTALRAFFAEMLRLPRGTTADMVALREETMLVLDELAARRAPFTELFTVRHTFVDDTLAKLYGLPERPGAKFVKVTLPEAVPRQGLLGHASVLSVFGADPTLRGKMVRESLLCQTVPPPPPEVTPELPKPTADAPKSARERLAQHQKDPACAGCHALVDPIGLALHSFDGNGRYRTTEFGLPIDTSGELDGVPFKDARGLSTALAKHPKVPECLVRSLHRHITGQVEGAGQEASVARLSEEFVQKGQQVADLVLAIVGSPAFSEVTTAP